MKPGFDIIRMDASLGVAICGRVFVSQFYGPATVELLEELRVLHAAVARGTTFVIFSFIDPSTGRDMGKEARQKAAAVAREMEPFTIASTFVVLAEGFGGAVARSVLTSVQLFSGAKHPWKVLGDMDAAVTWTQGQLGPAAADDKALWACCAAILAGVKKPPTS
jgi:hypothetical protein